MQDREPLPFRDLLVVTQYYAPEPGAPQIRLRSMVRELRRLGVRVRVLTGMPNYPTGRIFDGYRGKMVVRELIDEVPVRRVWLYPAAGRGSLRRILNYVSFTLSVLPAMLLGRRPDMVFVEAQPLTLAIPALLLKLLRRVPYVYNTPDLQVEVAGEEQWLGMRWLIRAAAALEGLLMRQAFSVTTVTHAFIRHFLDHRGIDRRKVSFLPNGADIERLRPLRRDLGYAEKLAVGDRKVFTYAGTHAHYQGLEVILEAAKKLRDRDDIVILMVGRGPMRQQLIDMAERDGIDNVIFGESPFDEMPALMSVTEASIVVLKDIPAARKMRLSKAIPPLACGVPVLYAGPGESAEIIEREGCGVRIDPGRPDLLAAAIRRLADDPAERAAMGARGRSLAVRQFSWSTIVEDWIRQLGRVAAGQEPEIAGLD